MAGPMIVGGKKPTRAGSRFVGETDSTGRGQQMDAHDTPHAAVVDGLIFVNKALPIPTVALQGALFIA
jgi:hypothetical protein